MARRPPAPPEEPRLTSQQMGAAIERFRRRLADLDGFDPQTVRDRQDPCIDALEAAIGEAFAEAFGFRTPAYQRYAPATSIDTARHNYAYEVPHHEIIEGLVRGKERAITLINQAIRSFEEKLAEIGGEHVVAKAPQPAERSPDVFIIHGHDDQAKVQVARLIERAGLNAVILHEQPNAGRTVIEKFEAHGGAAGFAVAILTPDDVGGPNKNDLKARARQNVIGELFWFAGKLGRQNVCALKKGEVEIPSDFAGVLYTEMDDRGAWKQELLRELQNAGYQVNWEKALA